MYRRAWRWRNTCFASCSTSAAKARRSRGTGTRRVQGRGLRVEGRGSTGEGRGANERILMGRLSRQPTFLDPRPSTLDAQRLAEPGATFVIITSFILRIRYS